VEYGRLGWFFNVTFPEDHGGVVEKATIEN